MIEKLPCPITGCPHSHGGSGKRFTSKSTLLRHLCHPDHQPTFHLADHSICSKVDIYTCCHTTCPTAPTQFFRSLNDLLMHNTLHHPPPPPPPPPPTSKPTPEPTTTSNDYYSTTSTSSTASTCPDDFPTTHTTLNTPLLLSTSILYPEAQPNAHNLWHHGL